MKQITGDHIILVSACLSLIPAHAQRKSFLFVKKEHCPLTKLHNQLLDRSKLVSNVDCVRKCIHHTLCHYTRSVSEEKSPDWCELFQVYTSPQSQPPPSAESHDMTLPPKVTVYCYEPCGGVHSSPTCINVATPPSDKESTIAIVAPSPYCCADDIHKDMMQTRNLEVYIDLDRPETLTEEALEAVGQKIMDAKVVFLDPSNVLQAISINCPNALNGKFKSMLVYAMDKDENGFKPNASRLSYAITYEGNLYLASADINNMSTAPLHKLSMMRVFGPQDTAAEYTMQTDNNNSTLIDWVKRGFSFYNYRYAVITDDESAVSFFKINEHLNKLSSGQPQVPLFFTQRTQASYLFRFKMQVKFGDPRSVKNLKTFPTEPMIVSTLWQPFSNFLNYVNDEETTLLGRLMFLGHRFRVSLRGTFFFDISEVLMMDDNFYFLLPQQVDTFPKNKFTRDTFGIRGVLSLRGRYSWCSHSIEGEDVLDDGIESGASVQPFVDKKKWTAVYSVFSNGTLAFGSVSELANRALEGRDVNFLIEWTNQHRARLLSTCMVSVRNHGLPEVLVSAESKVTWHLVEGPDGDMEMSPSCDLEKVLVKSDGEVQVLAYNTHTRRAVVIPADVKSTWFTH